MSEKFPSSNSGELTAHQKELNEAAERATDESIAREHGGYAPLHESHSNNNFSNGEVYDSLGYSDEDKDGGISDAEREARIAEETGTIYPDKQKLVRELQQHTFNDETLQKDIDILADEPDAIKQVIEMRLRISLGKNDVENLNKDQLRADLKIIDLALEHGIDVGAMRIDAEPMTHGDKKTKPVGAWLDRLANELNMTSMPSLENPDKLAPARDQVTEIRNKLNDPEETPEEKAEREEAEAEAKAQEEEAARKEAERQENERNAKAVVEKAMEAQKQAYQTELDAKQLGHEIYREKEALANALQEAASLKSSLSFFQQRFGKGKKSLAEANQHVADIRQKLATLEDEQAQKIALLEGPNSAA